jgi:hypothetical protein
MRKVEGWGSASRHGYEFPVLISRCFKNRRNSRQNQLDRFSPALRLLRPSQRSRSRGRLTEIGAPSSVSFVISSSRDCLASRDGAAAKKL